MKSYNFKWSVKGEASDAITGRHFCCVALWADHQALPGRQNEDLADKGREQTLPELKKKAQLQDYLLLHSDESGVSVVSLIFSIHLL